MSCAIRGRGEGFLDFFLRGGELVLKLAQGR